MTNNHSCFDWGNSVTQATVVVPVGLLAGRPPSLSLGDSAAWRPIAGRHSGDRESRLRWRCSEVQVGSGTGSQRPPAFKFDWSSSWQKSVQILRSHESRRGRGSEASPSHLPVTDVIRKGGVHILHIDFDSPILHISHTFFLHTLLVIGKIL